MEKKYKLGITLIGILSTVGLFSTIYNILRGDDFLVGLSNLVVYALVLIYATDGYKKPHGNMLKWLMITFALTKLSVLVKAANDGAMVNVVVIPIIMMMIAYMSGRLNKIMKNRYLAVVILLLLCHVAISAIVNLHVTDIVNIVSMCSGIILWIDLSSAYFLRFARHKEVGLLDKADKQ